MIYNDNNVEKEIKKSVEKSTNGNNSTTITPSIE